MSHAGRRAAAGASGWIPTDVANLGFWVKADTLSLSDGDNVTSMTDQSGNGRSPDTQLNAWPLYKATAFNSAYPCIRTDSTERGIYYNGTVGGADNWTIFCAVQTPSGVSDNTGSAYFTHGNGSSSGVSLTHRYPTYDSNTYVGVLYGGVSWHGSTTATPTAASLVVVRRSSGTMKMYLNGGASVLSTATAPNAPSGVIHLLWNFYHSGKPTTDLAEAGIYNAALSDADVNLLGGYMASRYGLSWSAIS